MIADIDAAAGERTASELRAGGFRALAVSCDVADEFAVEAAVDRTIDEFGGIDILINNVGLHLLHYSQPFSVLSRDDLRALFDVNVIGVVNCTVPCRPSMRSRGGGAVLNIVSTALHLCSDQAGSITGGTVKFSGGYPLSI